MLFFLSLLVFQRPELFAACSVLGMHFVCFPSKMCVVGGRSPLSVVLFWGAILQFVHNSNTRRPVLSWSCRFSKIIALVSVLSRVRPFYRFFIRQGADVSCCLSLLSLLGVRVAEQGTRWKASVSSRGCSCSSVTPTRLQPTPRDIYPSLRERIYYSLVYYLQHLRLLPSARKVLVPLCQLFSTWISPC